MDAWTIFGLFKLFLDVVEGGPAAAVRGVLMMGVPGSEILDVGEVFGLFDLDGNYQGSVTLSDAQYVPFNNIRLLNRDALDRAMARLDFPKLAQLEFARMNRRSVKRPQFPHLDEE